MRQLAFVALFLVVACSPQNQTQTPNEAEQNDAPGITAQADKPLRGMSNAEALVDFDTIVNAFRSLYGAMERKQARYGFELEAMATDYRGRVKAAKTEAAYRGLFQEFIARFQNPHISLMGDLNSDDTDVFTLPFVVMPIEGTYVVYAAAAASPVKTGDELLQMDGRAAADLVADFSKYVSNANPVSKKHFAAEYLTFRDVFLAPGLAASTEVQVRGADGKVRTETVAWSKAPHALPAAAPKAPLAGTTNLTNGTAYTISPSAGAQAELIRMGARTPYFFTKAALATIGSPSEIALTADSLAKVQLAQADATAINYYAVKYTTGSKRVLFVRLPDYEPKDTDNALKYLQALFSQEQANVDVLVLDQTHNPGGNIFFAEGVTQLLAKKTYNGYVEKMHADRKWIDSLLRTANYVRQNYPKETATIATFDGYVRAVNDAYDAGLSLAPALPFFVETPTTDPDPAHWTKPVVMLADELSVSCADFVPLVFKSNGMGTLFGGTTMGGGGNVESMGKLPNSQLELNISRGLGTVYDPSGAYPEDRFIEDNGVPPDVAVAPTLADLRAGFVGYVAAINAAALAAK